jgi:hypothetical protein
LLVPIASATTEPLTAAPNCQTLIDNRQYTDELQEMNVARVERSETPGAKSDRKSQKTSPDFTSFHPGYNSPWRTT